MNAFQFDWPDEIFYRPERHAKYLSLKLKKTLYFNKTTYLQKILYNIIAPLANGSSVTIKKIFETRFTLQTIKAQELLLIAPFV